MELYTSHGAIISTAMLLVSDSILGKLYTYTPDGIRSSKTVNGTKTEYLLNGTQILAQKTGSDVMWFFYDSTGTRIGVQQGNVTAYYMYNLQGDVVGLADAATGKIIAKYLYDAWGKCVSVENADGYTIGTANPFRYCGYYYDNDTGLYYLQSRYYDPAIGRFINADTYTTTDADGLLSTNMFAYCENNPVMGTDPTGEWVHLAVGAIVGGIMGGISAAAFGGNVISGIATGALGGALAISGAGRAAQIVGSAALSAINNTVTQLTSKPIASFSINELITETASGALAGVLGGEGASITNAKSIMGYGKQAIKQIKGNIKHGKSVFKPIKNYLSRAHVKGNQSVFKAFAKSITLPTLYSNGRNIYKQFFVNR